MSKIPKSLRTSYVHGPLLQNKYQFDEGKNVNILRIREQNFDKVLSSAVSQPPRKKVLTHATDSKRRSAVYSQFPSICSTKKLGQQCSFGKLAPFSSNKI